MDPIDKSKLLETFLGNVELLNKCLDEFFKSYPKHIEGIQAAIENKDLKKLKYHAHTLKGHLRYFQQTKLQNLMEQIENISTEMDLSKADGNFQSVKESFPDLLKELEAVKAL